MHIKLWKLKLFIFYIIHCWRIWNDEILIIMQMYTGESSAPAFCTDNSYMYVIHLIYCYSISTRKRCKKHSHNLIFFSGVSRITQCNNYLSEPGNSKMMHHGILFNALYSIHLPKHICSIRTTSSALRCSASIDSDTESSDLFSSNAVQ